MDKNANWKIELWEWLSFWDEMAKGGMSMTQFVPQLKAGDRVRDRVRAKA